MMWYAAILRFIRRRLVLALIFFLSLTYCVVNLIKNGGPLSNNDNDDYEVKRQQPLIWRTLPPQQIELNITNDLTILCRNSVQGKVLIVDDRGFVCSRTDLLSTGCCNLDVISTKQYSCETCNKYQCCAIYEYCVSCCLHPDKKEILENVLTMAKGKQVAVFATVKDQYELCLAKCRTDSHSVQHENKYRDPKSKHCYGLTVPHESQRDILIQLKNFENN